MVSKICGVALFSASCSSQPALRRAVPHSEVPAAVPANGAVSTDQEAISTVCRTRVAGAHHLGGERLDVGGGNPRRAETRGDIRRPQVFGLHAPQRGDVARVLGVALGRGLGDRELGADGTREIGVVRLPGFRAGIAEHRFAELGEGGLRIAVQQFGQVVDVHAAGLVEGDSERIGRRRDVWC